MTWRHLLSAVATLSIGAAASATTSPAAPIWTAPALPGWQNMHEIDLTGVIEQGRFRPRSLMPLPLPEPHAAPALPLVPMNSDILPLARTRMFGSEERVQMMADSHGLAISCGGGDSPAGVVIDWPTYQLPAGYHGRWSVTGQMGDAAIGLSATVAGADAPPQPDTLLGSRAALPYDAGRRQLVVVCPHGATDGRLTGIAIVPAAGATPEMSRGTWVWDDGAWQGDPGRFAAAAAAAGWTELAVQVPRTPAAPLVELIETLRSQQIAVRLVDGEPDMASAAGTDAAARRFAMLRAWCDRHLRAAQRPSLDLDIEPYARPGFSLDPGAAWNHWADAVRAIAAAWGAPVTVDVPWWMNRSNAGEAALGRAGGAIGSIVVMAYRTDPQLIVDAAAPWLADGRWPVRIAIETGPVAREATRHYRRADRGTLRLTDRGAELFASPVAAGASDAVFALTGEDVTDPARISFHDALPAADAAERAVAPILAGWPQFDGWRVHGWTSPTLETRHA